jgi:hypothetical protein
MKCIDPWLLNSRRQCPVCKRYVFPDQDNSDDEENNAQATEQTPLIQPSNDNTIAVLARNRQLGKYIMARNQSRGFNSNNLSLDYILLTI